MPIQTFCVINEVISHCCGNDSAKSQGRVNIYFNAINNRKMKKFRAAKLEPP
jgi:hypothetical protein